LEVEEMSIRFLIFAAAPALGIVLVSDAVAQTGQIPSKQALAPVAPSKQYPVAQVAPVAPSKQYPVAQVAPVAPSKQYPVAPVAPSKQYPVAPTKQW
jgi:uncharacterized secreted protein with C-terminal beta-propeller domain